MTETTNAPLDAIRGLVAERARYDGWLATLEQRRGATPAHVFDRVWQDYDGRRQGVLAALARHADPLRSTETALAHRHDELTRALGERRDLLAEIELRTLVGEYEGDEGARLRTDAEGAIATLEAELVGVDGELAEVRELLGHVESAASVGASQGQGAPAYEGGASSVGTPAGGVAVVDAARRVVDEGATSEAPAPGEFGAGLALEPGLADVGEPERDGALTPAGDLADESRGLRADGATVGYAGSPLLDAPLRADGFASAPSFTGQGFAEVGVGGAASLPRETPSPTAQKTLRCQDCGEMNYPTEWYCERCGGELAAL